MEAISKEVGFAGYEKPEAVEPSESTRFLQSSLLSEAPGVVYGLVALAFIVSALMVL